MKSIISAQRGVALLMGLIMLVVMTLFAVTIFKLGKGGLQIVGNMQLRNQAQAAAQSAIEEVLSTATFVTTPANAIRSPCGGVANKICVDVNGDGVTDVNVVVTPTCVSVKIIPVAALSFSNANDVGCLVGLSQEFGVSGASNNDSLCANMLWDINAVATDPINNAQFSVNQGVAVRVSSSAVCP